MALFLFQHSRWQFSVNICSTAVETFVQKLKGLVCYWLYCKELDRSSFYRSYIELLFPTKPFAREVSRSYPSPSIHQAPVVQRLDNFTQWISCCPMEQLYFNSHIWPYFCKATYFIIVFPNL